MRLSLSRSCPDPAWPRGQRTQLEAVRDKHGLGQVRAQIPRFLLRVRRPDPVSRDRRHRDNAEGCFPVGGHPGGHDHLDLYRPDHSRDGEARYHLLRIFALEQHQWHQEHREPDDVRGERHQGIFPTGREPRPRDRAMRRVRQLDSRRHAAGHPATDRGALLRFLGARDFSWRFLRTSRASRNCSITACIGFGRR